MTLYKHLVYTRIIVKRRAYVSRWDASWMISKGVISPTELQNSAFYQPVAILVETSGPLQKNCSQKCNALALLTHRGRGLLNSLNARSRGLIHLHQLLYGVSLKIYNKFANYFYELKFSGNTHQRP